MARSPIVVATEVREVSTIAGLAVTTRASSKELISVGRALSLLSDGQLYILGNRGRSGGFDTDFVV